MFLHLGVYYCGIMIIMTKMTITTMTRDEDEYDDDDI